MKKFILFLFLLPTFLSAQEPGLDILHYRFELSLSDSSDEIRGLAHVRYQLTDPQKTEVALDLVSESNGKGMKVTRVSWGEKAGPFSQND